jgi:hypothetical protein
VDLYYNQNYSRDQIGAVLAKIKSCVTSNHYTVALNETGKRITISSTNIIFEVINYLFR